MKKIFKIEENVEVLTNSVEKARTNLTEKLKRGGVAITGTETLRELIELIPSNYYKPSEVKVTVNDHSASKVDNIVFISGGYNGRTTGRQRGQCTYDIRAYISTSKNDLYNDVSGLRGAVINNKHLISGGNVKSYFSHWQIWITEATGRQDLYDSKLDISTTVEYFYGASGFSSTNIKNTVLMNGGIWWSRPSSPSGPQTVNYNSRQQIYDGETNTLATKKELTYPTSGHATALAGEKVYIYGGNNGAEKKHQSYDINTETFSDLKATIYSMVNHRAVAIKQGETLGVLYTGGSNTNKRQSFYDIESNSFITKATLPTARVSHSSIAFEDVVLTSCGTSGSYDTNTQELYSFTSDKFFTEPKP